MGRLCRALYLLIPHSTVVWSDFTCRKNNPAVICDNENLYFIYLKRIVFVQIVKR